LFDSRFSFSCSWFRCSRYPQPGIHENASIINSAARIGVKSVLVVRPNGNMVRIAVVSPQQIRKLAINYMTHPIHYAAPVCFIGAGLGVNVPRIDGASTSIGAARPHQSTL
jgi:hypothetical protein